MWSLWTVNISSDDDSLQQCFHRLWKKIILCTCLQINKNPIAISLLFWKWYYGSLLLGSHLISTWTLTVFSVTDLIVFRPFFPEGSEMGLELFGIFSCLNCHTGSLLLHTKGWRWKCMNEWRGCVENMKGVEHFEELLNEGNESERRTN